MAEKILPLFATPVLHMTEVGMDLKKLKKFILNTKKMNDGRTLTNVGGWQSNDLQHKPNEELQKFIEILKGVATRYSIGIEIEPKYKLEQIWANVNGPKDFNERHKHLNAIYSGVYFVDVPENSGNFSLTHNVPDFNFAWCHFNGIKIKKYNAFNAGTWNIKPQADELFLFPSWAEHKVTPNLSNSDRISISFDLS